MLAQFLPHTYGCPSWLERFVHSSERTYVGELGWIQVEKPLVLIVEDQAPLQEMLATVVEQLLNARAVLVDQAATLVEKVKSLKPAVILMDTAVPGGIQAIKKLKSDPETQRVPAIAFNTRGWATCHEALEAGYDACVEDSNVDRLDAVA